MSIAPNDLVISVITAVKARPILWDRQHKFFQRKIETREEWIEVSKELDISLKEVQKIWGTTRTKFHIHLKNKKAKTPKHALHQHLEFLIPHLVRLKMNKLASARTLSDETRNTLIEEIKRRPVIWDKQHREFYKKANREAAYNEIAKITQIPLNQLPLIWRNIRETFRSTYHNTVAKNEELKEQYDNLKFLIAGYNSELSELDPNIHDGMEKERKLIIKEVQNFPILWDQFDRNFNNNKLKSKIWIEIAKKLKIPSKEVIEAWRRIRGNFQKKLSTSIFKNDKSILKKYYLYKDLKFLLPHLQMKDKLNIEEYNESDEETDESEEKFKFDEIEREYELLNNPFLENNEEENKKMYNQVETDEKHDIKIEMEPFIEIDELPHQKIIKTETDDFEIKMETE